MPVTFPLAPTAEAPSALPFDPSPDLPAMRAAAARVLRSSDLAEDAVQDALTRLWRQGARPLPDGAVLCRLATLSALSILRSRARRERHEHAACGSRHHEPAITPDEEAMRSEWGQQLETALAGLPRSLREPLVLFCFEGHDYACIAASLGWPIGTVRSRLFRARSRLKRLLGRETGLEIEDRPELCAHERH
jgi:RNA polymerase sigma-70 factor (ECF subfamily)